MGTVNLTETPWTFKTKTPMKGPEQRRDQVLLLGTSTNNIWQIWNLKRSALRRTLREFRTLRTYPSEVSTRLKGLDWLIAAEINFSSIFAQKLVELKGLPSINTMGPVSARMLQDVRVSHKEQRRDGIWGRLLKKSPTRTSCEDAQES